MKIGVGYITLSDGKMHFLLQPERNAKPLQLVRAVETDAEALQAALDHARGEGVPFGRAVLAIDGRDCLLRNFQFPAQGRRQLGQMVAFELESDLPLESGDALSDFCIGGRAGGLSFVTTATIRKERIRALLEAGAAQGVEIERIDLDVAAFARACAGRFADRDRLVGLEIGQGRTLFCALEGGRVQRLAVLPQGEAQLVAAVARAAKQPRETVERYMVLGPAAAQGPAVAELKALFDKHLEAFLLGLLRETYRVLGGEEWPAGFVVSGEIVRVQRFREAFERLSEGRLDIWEETCLSLGEEMDDGMRGSSLALGFGAAEEHGPGFDFRKEEFARADAAGPWARELRTVGVFALVLALAWGGYVWASLAGSGRELAMLREATLALYKDALPNVGDDLAISQYQSILAARMGVFTDSGDAGPGAAGSEPIIGTLRDLSTCIKGGLDVEIVNLSQDSRSIEIQGEARSMGDVDAVRQALDETKKFAEVKVKNAIADKQSKRIRFELEVVR